jgi:hypothetical protein
MKRLLHHLPRASGPALLGSLVSLASQAVFALFLLKLFEPAAVGVFSVVNQVAFSWATLALAQSTLTLLADPAHPASGAMRAWRQSLLRFAALTPLAIAAWWWTSPPRSGIEAGPLVWIAAIAATQLSWSIAQSLTLRTGPGSAIFFVRCVPPALAAILAWLCAPLLPRSEPTALLVAALVGYAVGARWLLPAATSKHEHVAESSEADAPRAGRDDRSARLKMFHTLMDLASSTLIAIQWTRTWGAVEAGYLLVLLRVFGFVPALVHTAWAQVLLSRGEARVGPSLAIGALASLGIVVLAIAMQAALALGGLSASWAGLANYLWPLAIWQMAACMFGCLSHLPFLEGRARAYSLQCIGVDVMLIAALIAGPPIHAAPARWVLVIASLMTAALLVQAWYFRARQAEAKP